VIARAEFRALGTGARVLTVYESALEPAVRVVERELERIDQACSRFREDSELAQFNRRSGTWVPVSPLLLTAIEAAVRACRMTNGAVDPTMGRAIRILGYDQDFANLRDVGPINLATGPAAGAGVIETDARRQRAIVRGGHEIDLGATAKALAADLSARAAFEACGVGVLVSLGGDIAIAGPAPADGWSILVAEDHAASLESSGQVIVLKSGAIATSTTTLRRWRQGGVDRHHILDPATGAPAREHWRTASVVAANCVDANAAATASIVWGEPAVGWLQAHRLPGRLVAADGSITRVAGWPSDGAITG
jgi:thiamine biosynthesis lipoprotein